ncbi:MAG: Hydrogenase maturation protease [Ignavibacteriae bacterium]|nr:MAG: Hydrogenase maturation protease [Ignavibacteriota bacterium]
MEKKIIIIGLGNEYISDDGIGIRVVRELQKKIENDDRIPFWYKIKFEEQAVGGLGILDIILGYDICVIIDAMYTKEKRVGTLYRYFQKTDKELINIKSSHQISLSQVLSLAKLLNYKLPSVVVVYGIEVEDVTTFGESCTPEVERNIKNLTTLVYNDLVDFNVERLSENPLSVYIEEESIN